MFTDSRSKKVILVSHCVLNQNSKIDRCAVYPGAMCEVTRLLLDEDIGILQMPCPELLSLGLDRQKTPGVQASVEDEDDRVALLMNRNPAVIRCSVIASVLVDQVEQYQSFGFQVLGILGINGSPTCGVETNWATGKETPGPGVLIRCILDECERRGIHIVMHGIKAQEPQTAIRVVRDLCKEN